MIRAQSRETPASFVTALDRVMRRMLPTAGAVFFGAQAGRCIAAGAHWLPTAGIIGLAVLMAWLAAGTKTE